MAGNQVSCKALDNPTVIVTAPQLSTALVIEPSANKTVKIGDTFTIKATLSPDNVTNKKVNWTSSNSSLATVSTNESASGTSITVTAKKTGTVTITATPGDGQAQYAKSITVTINPLTIADISPEYYGDYMDYPVELGLTTAEHTLVDGTIPKTDWRVFYKDDTYTYLIASDYIPTSKFPEGVFTGNNGKYSGWWSSVPNATTPTETYKSRFLWNSLDSVYKSNTNYKCVTYLLNTNLWLDFTNTTYAEACIGGSTLEMMCASWNEAYPSQKLYYGVNSTGYLVGKGNDKLYSYIDLWDYDGYNNTLYFPHNRQGSSGPWNDAQGYWFSVASSQDSGTLACAGRTGQSTWTHYYQNYIAVRPVVMLKSTLLAEKHDVDGVWEIKGNSLTLDVTEDQEKFICNTFEVTPTVHSSIENKNVNWYSSNTSVATVSTTTTESGTAVLVKCVGEGEATITAVLASDNKQSESFKVTVSDTYVNYPVDLGIANNTAHTLVDGTVPKTDWRIFYQDGTYTYLIAADYIPTSKFPAGVFTSNNGKYSGWWSSTPTGTTPTWEYKDRFLFNGMNTVNSSNANYKCVSYLLNTTLWESFVDSKRSDINTDYADAAIGSPTLEMVCASWNASTPNQLLHFGVNTIGYTVGKSTSSLAEFLDLLSCEGTNNTLYFPHNRNGYQQVYWNSCYGYWLSSPSSGGTDRINSPSADVAIGHASCNLNYQFAIRPVVCLKSSTKLTKDTNGIWQLSN